MIIDFSVKNFRSIRALQTISFAATKLDSNQDKFPELDDNNIVLEGGERILRTIGIYGANASGKSNIIRALEAFSESISHLPSPVSRLSNLTDPFLYQDNPDDSETFFQITFLHQFKKYRYGFTVKKNTANIPAAKDPSANTSEAISREIITSEWLEGPKQTNQVKLFTRKFDEVEKSGLPDSKDIPDIPYRHTLFLTHAASFKQGICSEIRMLLAGYFLSNFTHGSDIFRRFGIKLLDNEGSKKSLIDFMIGFNIKYDDIEIEKDEDSKKLRFFPRNKITLSKTSPNGSNVKLNLEHHESEGTKKLFDLAGFFLTAFNLPIGGFVALDELDSNFHPALVVKLIKLFNNKTINRSNMQLVFTSHDTNLLDPEIMRRDQFYFAEKDSSDSTRIYSLANLKGIRNDADFAKQYLAGYYGALPILDDFSPN